MALVDKEELLGLIRTLQGFDVDATPYAALVLPTDFGKAKFYRSSLNGFIMSKNIVVDDSAIYVGLAHFQNVLSVLKKESKVDLSLEDNPNAPDNALNKKILTINTNDGTYGNRLHVHTVDVGQSALKRHNIGDIITKVPIGAFKGFDSRPFGVVGQPLMVKGKIMLPTPTGVVFWQGPSSLEDIKLHPRDSFLRFLSNENGDVIEISITSNNYWGAETNSGVINYLKGHETGAHLFHQVNVVGEKFAEFPMNRLMEVLEAASSLADERRVHFSPVVGVTFQDAYGASQTWEVGKGNWEGFAVNGKALKLIYAAFKQVSTEIAVLYRVETPDFTAIRFTSGPWEVNVKEL